MASEKLRTDIRRDQILQVVLTLIATRGARSLSMAAVARRVGLVPSALYRHFKNKDEILDAAIEQVQALVQQNLKAVAESSPNSIEQLRRLLMRQIRMIRENQLLALPRIVFSEDLYVSRPQRKSKVYGMVRGSLESLGDLIREGQARREIRRDLDATAAARMLLALMQSSAILWFISEGEFDVTKNAERCWKVFKRVIAA